jgi:hypothetical protein
MVTDEAFHEEFKPLHIPSAYRATDSWKDRVVFALAEIGLGTADEVAAELLKRDTSLDEAEVKTQATTILTNLFNKGLIKGSQLHHGLVFNLSKIIIQNSGSARSGH